MIAPNESLAGKPAVTLLDIEKQTGRFADARDVLSGYVATLNEKLEALKRAAMGDIKRALSRAVERQAELEELIAANPHLFTDPKTVTFHNIKVGLRKGIGSIAWTEDAELVARLKKLFGEEAENFIRTTEKPIARALGTLDAATLKKLGCTVEDTGDVVVIKPTDGEIEKIVNALLKSANEEAA